MLAVRSDTRLTIIGQEVMRFNSPCSGQLGERTWSAYLTVWEDNFLR